MILQNITAIHLHSNLQNEPEELGSMSYIWIFSSVAFFMLLIACINYMNLTTARSARRAKEIGIRKVTGSIKKTIGNAVFRRKFTYVFDCRFAECFIGMAFIIYV